jgi:hypothetical protein
MAENLRQQEEELKQNMEEMMASQEESEKLITFPEEGAGTTKTAC